MKTLTLFCLSVGLVAAVSCAVPMSKINLDQDTAGVVLVVEPDRARVFLDGRFVGKAADFNGSDKKLELSRGGHVLRFEAEGFQNEWVEIVSGRETETLRIKMLPRPSDEKEKG